MSEVVPELLLEIPSNVEQEEVDELNEQLNQIKGVSADLQESKNIFSQIVMVLNIIASDMGIVGAIAGGAVAVHEVAQKIHEFIHAKNERFDVVLRKKGKRVELKNLTIEQIERLLREP